MLSHSSHTARLDPGKDRGRRVREQGSRGEAKKGENWAGGAGWAGVGWCSAGGEEGEVIKRRSCGVADIYVRVCVCACVRAPDLESDGVAGVAEVMRGPRGRWVKMISGKQPPATQTH